MRVRLLTLVSAAAVVASLGACGDDEDDSPGDTTSSATTTAGSSDPSVGGTSVEAATADLANRLGVGPDDITVVEARDVTWPDSSLGCPQPGQNYTQVLSEGFLVVLEVDGQQHEYHAGPDGRAFFCAEPSAPAPD